MSDIATIHKEKHEFALHIESLSSLLHYKSPHDTIIFTDEKLLHRMMTVLRLQVTDECMFFDQKMFISAKIVSFTGKKQITLSIQSISSTKILYPQITFLLPLLKRDDYEAALYTLTELGINNIQLVFTQKTGTQWADNRDKDRAQRIIIAAAEQSKNFAYPTLQAPISLEAALKKYSNITTKIFFDPQGTQLFSVMTGLHTTQPKELLLLIGPEGDLILEEKKIVVANNFIFCALTPTIIRSVQAAALAAGFIRSLFR